jgi:hypothetical protein
MLRDDQLQERKEGIVMARRDMRSVGVRFGPSRARTPFAAPVGRPVGSRLRPLTAQGPNGRVRPLIRKRNPPRNQVSRT